MKNIFSILLLGSVLLVGCATNSNNTHTIYDQNSREDIIPKTCQKFFDGCNQGSRMKSGDKIIHTKKYCKTYSKPYCMDNKNNTTTDKYIGLTITEAQKLAQKSQQSFRIVKIDGIAQIVTMDYLVGRLNATAMSGIITDITVE